MRMMRTTKHLPAALLALCTLPLAAKELLFTFADAPPVIGAVAVTPDDVFSEGKGYGWMQDKDSGSRRFAVELEEGNYDVAVRLGSQNEETETTVKAEDRRLVLLNEKTEPGEFVNRTFTVNVRRPEYGGHKVLLNGREVGTASWDGMLNLQFSGTNPRIAALQITPNKEALTVFLAGDSTVTDQGREPWAGWGQMLPVFFQPGTAISNHAESGLTLRSFEYQGRLKKVLNMMKKGDYLFIQFGHNDQKDKRDGAGPFTTYKAKLAEFVKTAREKGGIPVLVTPVERRRWSGGKPQATLADFAEAVRQAGREHKVPVIDLNAMSLETYAALGDDGSRRAFVHFPAHTFPGQETALKDDSHHSNFGGYLLARCMVRGIREELPELAARLRPGIGECDPSKPATLEAASIPPEPVKATPEKPAGD